MTARTGDTASKILFIDAYDSFTYNIVSLIETSLNVEVTVIKIDDVINNLASFLRPFAAVVAGPGPGHPNNAKDTGLFRALWTLKPKDTVPVLGICLGFQSLVTAAGGKILQLPEPRHGMLRTVRTSQTSLFEGIDEITAVQYHSLYADIGKLVGNSRAPGDLIGEKEDESSHTELIPLAWDCDGDNSGIEIGNQKNNPKTILMGVAHRTKPFYGVQFHPESICSDVRCQKIIPNWWRLVTHWNARYRCPEIRITQYHFVPRAAVESELSSNADLSGRSSVEHSASSSMSSLSHHEGTNGATYGLPNVDHHYEVTPNSHVHSQSGQSYPAEVFTRSIPGSHLNVPGICERLELPQSEVVVLDSECNQRPQTGRYSIIGIVSPDSVKLEYNVGRSFVRCKQEQEVRDVSLQPYGGSIFQYLKSFTRQHSARNGNPDVPFWGGLVGYITYEACLETLGIEAPSNPVDLGFAFVERSLVIDHERATLHIQSIKQHDEEWVASVASMLPTHVSSKEEFRTAPLKSLPVSLPDEKAYQRSIRDCQSYLRSGDSYELCLTTQATVDIPDEVSAWALYRDLRTKNPAPFAGYVKLGPLTHISSSPERFFSWTRPTHLQPQASNGYQNGCSSVCQFRPIKGTVKRHPHGKDKPAVTLEQATAILSTPKERAENLMIVDLIRHDLHGVVGSGNVKVPKLMVVEEYATLFQLVTVVEGTLYSESHGGDQGQGKPSISQDKVQSATKGLRLMHDHGPPSIINSSQVEPPPISDSTGLNGIDVLAASLPPGSMTGAPKKRSCSILRNLEGRNRGVYSGVLGYMDVGGGGDFSVVIRSAFSWDRSADFPSEAPTSNVSARATEEQSEIQRNDDHANDFASHVNGGCRQTLDNEYGPKESMRCWTIGAGGAVTCLSTEDGEWEEMRGKLSSTLGAFTGMEI